MIPDWRSRGRFDRVPRAWGATPAEIRAVYPCDRLAAGPAEAWYRAVSVQASPPTVFRWLCQLQVAPYSYDLVDNGGRRSPRRLIDGLERLSVGQRFMQIFRLVDFTPGVDLTLRMESRRARAAFGDFLVTYAVRAGDRDGSRLVAKLVLPGRPGRAGRVRRRLLAWGDLVMMRRQLLNLRDLAERDAAAGLV